MSIDLLIMMLIVLLLQCILIQTKWMKKLKSFVSFF